MGGITRIPDISVDLAVLALFNGNHHNYSEKFIVAAGPVLDILLQVGATRAVLGVTLVVEGDLDMFFFEGTTFSAAGTVKTSFNSNRDSSNTLSTIISEGPTIISNGTQLFESFIPAGSKNQSLGGFATGGGLFASANTDYMFRIDNTSGGNQDIALSFDFFEDVE